MGGQALKNTFTRRYQKDEFDKIAPVIKEKLLKVFPKVDMPKYFRSKPSFGDADFVCMATDKNIDFEKFFVDEFQSKEIFKNGHVYSIEYKELQVDIIITPEKAYETSLSYFAWNDCGNLIGKVAHRFGLKWGYKGLVYKYTIDGKKLGEFVITTDYRKALAFLGFDVARYDEGFDNLQEIFDFVTSSKYFNPWMFDFETLNRINRERDQKRATYAAFVEHVAPMKEIGREQYHYFYHDKKAYLALIDASFPGFFRKYRGLEKKEERKRAVHALYNGRLIMEAYPTLSGKFLGTAMHAFSDSFANLEAMEDWILETNDTEKILEHFANITRLTL